MGYRLTHRICATLENWRTQTGASDAFLPVFLQFAPVAPPTPNQPMQETLGTYGFAPVRQLRHFLYRKIERWRTGAKPPRALAQHRTLAAHGRLAPTACRPCARLHSGSANTTKDRPYWKLSGRTALP